jgi:hypothetical protein
VCPFGRFLGLFRVQKKGPKSKTFVKIWKEKKFEKENQKKKSKKK